MLLVFLLRKKLKESKISNDVFAEQIDKIEDEMSELNSYTKNFLDEIEKEYCSDTANWKTKLTDTETRFYQDISGVDKVKQLKPKIDNCNELIDKIMNSLREEIYNKINAKLEELNVDFRISFLSILFHNLPKFHLGSTMKKAKRITSKIKKPIKRKRLKLKWEFPFVEEEEYKDGYEKVLDKEEYIENILEILQSESFPEHMEKIGNNINQNIGLYCQDFSSKINNFSEGKAQLLRKLEKEQESNEEIIDNIKKLAERKEKIEEELNKINSNQFSFI